MSLEDSWLSGFTDAEASFEVRIKTTRSILMVGLRFAISQKTPAILEKIKCCFNFNGNVNFDKSWEGYRLCCENHKHQKKLIDYFNKFPLKTKKKINFLRFKNIWSDKLNKLHLTEDGFKILSKKIKKFKKV